MLRRRATWPPRYCPGRRSHAQASSVHPAQRLGDQLDLDPVGILEVDRRHDPAVRAEVRDAALLESGFDPLELCRLHRDGDVLDTAYALDAWLQSQAGKIEERQQV